MLQLTRSNSSVPIFLTGSNIHPQPYILVLQYQQIHQNIIPLSLNTYLQMADHPDPFSLQNIYNYEIPTQQNSGCATGRSVQSSSSPNKTKRSLIRINHKKLPQDFFNFGTSKIYHQQLANKLNLSPAKSNKPEPEQKDKQDFKGIWLPNFGQQMMFGDQSVIISDETDIKKIRNRFARGLIKTNEECNSPLLPFKTIGALTPSPSMGIQSSGTEIFEWTFSKDMYCSISPTKMFQQKKEPPLRRGRSLKQRDLTDSLLARSCQKNYEFLVPKKQRKISIIPPRVATQFPQIHRK